jgi:hypothetical protein
MLSGIEVIRPDGSRTKLAAGESEALGGDAPPAPTSLPAPAPASLVLPMATDLQVHGDRLEEVSLSWPAGVTPARLEVARDHRFKNITLSGRPEGRHVNVTPPRLGSIYWRVLDEEGREVRRGKARFAPEGGASRQGRGASAVVADSGTAARLYYQSGAPAVTFAFTPHPRAVRYQLRVVKLGPKQKTILERTERAPRYTVTAGALRDGEYSWKATPIGAGGKPLGVSRDNHLTVTYDNAQVQLVIQRPRSWQRVEGPTVRVQGVAPLDSRLFVNGQEAPLDNKGRFNFPVDRASAVIFRLVGPSGNETVWVRGIKAGS